MYWEHFHPFGFFFFIILVGLLISSIIMWRRRHGMCYHVNRQPHSAFSILENRLASGEINIEEYNQIKETLEK
ncbi:hypothetical protein LG329_09250 [Virgibacillus necropolis]|uniref:hypothetical protein n=1 Tax=Virgibacillus necropolis TaxID=163877 RepID=UPI00384CBE8E